MDLNNASVFFFLNEQLLTRVIIFLKSAHNIN